MKKVLLAAGTCLLLGIPAANAQVILQHNPGSTSGDEWEVVNTETEERMSVMDADSAGARPADCPAGGYYRTVDAADSTRVTVTSCDTGDAFTAAEAGDGAEGLPEGAMLLNPMGSAETDDNDNDREDGAADTDDGGDDAGDDDGGDAN